MQDRLAPERTWYGWGRVRLFASILLLLHLLLASQGEAAVVRRLRIAGRSEAAVLDQREIAFRVTPKRGDTWQSLGADYLLPDSAEADLQAAVGVSAPKAGEQLTLPLRLLNGRALYEVLHALFPDDSIETAGWRHVVTYSNSENQENLYRVALWFTGKGDTVETLRAASELPSTELKSGQKLLVPADVLRAPLAEYLRGQGKLGGKKFVLASSDGSGLVFRKDRDLGDFAEYRLQPGQTIYRDVVIRFTGLLAAEAVNELAGKIAKDSYVDDVSDIPVNFPIRIRLEYLEPQFLPKEHPLYKDYVKHEQEMAEQVKAVEQVRKAEPKPTNLAGVLVILDPGHGGTDPGAHIGGVWEHDYVYDICVRVMGVLKQKTAARVELLLRDPKTKLLPVNQSRLERNAGEFIPTKPAYFPDEPGKSVNLRGFLANYYAAEHRKKGGKTSRQMLLSIHADALHQSVNGSMAYYPDSRYLTTSFDRSNSPFYMGFEEVQRLGGKVSFSAADQKSAEALGRKFGQTVMERLTKDGFDLHPNLPLRGSIIRQTRYVPAILRNTTMGTRLLVECVNLNNPRDRNVILDWQWRQNYAESLAQAIIQHFE